jgi:hypothetical protein
VNVPAKAIQREVRIVYPFPWKEMLIFVVGVVLFSVACYGFGYHEAWQRCLIEKEKSCPVMMQN